MRKGKNQTKVKKETAEMNSVSLLLGFVEKVKNATINTTQKIRKNCASLYEGMRTVKIKAVNIGNTNRKVDIKMLSVSIKIGVKIKQTVYITTIIQTVSITKTTVKKEKKK